MAGTTDTVKAKLTPGEFVIRKEAVDMIGVPMLNKLNDMPEEGGHSAIDNLIQRATLANMKMMYGGGMVQPNYAGGGMVEEKMYGYQNGGMALRMAPDVTPNMDYVNVDYDFDARLNRYGDEVFNPVIEQAENQANELARIKDSLYLFGQGKNPTEDRASLLAFLSKDEDDLSTREATLKRKFKRVEDDLESARIKSQRKSAEDLYAYDRGVRTREMQRALESGEVPYSDLFEEKNLREVQGLLKQIKKTDTCKQGRSDYRKEQRARSYKEGGLAGYENGGPVNQMPEPTADDPLQIDYRMANPEVYQGSTLGVVRQQAGALRDSIDQDTANKARKALQLLKLEGILKGEKVESPGLMPQIPSAADSSRLRDMLEYFKMQTMQNGSRP